MNKSSYTTSFIFIIVISQLITACSAGEQPAPINTFKPTNSVSPAQPSQSPTTFATQSPAEGDTPTPITIDIPSLPTPERSLSGEVVQDGPFTFDFRFYQDAKLGTNPVSPSLYSDLERIGLYFVWEYHGPNLPHL